MLVSRSVFVIFLQTLLITARYQAYRIKDFIF